MSIVEFLSQPVWQRLGLTLVHFLWQGLAASVLVGVSVRAFRLNQGKSRYAAYLLALILMIVCPVVTFTAIDIPISPDAEFGIEAESVHIADSVSYIALPEGDILPEAETASPAIGTLATSIPLSQRISDRLDISMPWLLVIWMVGVIVLSVRLLMGFVGVYRWRRHLEPLPERLSQRIASLSERLGMRRFQRVFISPTVLQAMAVGYLRPMVLLPAAMVIQMQPEMLEAVIAHELAHIRRFDLWVNLVQRVTETLLFYHPAVWWLSSCLRRERELCCDELAVKATGERITYASTLESVGRARLMAKQPILAAGLGQDNKPTLGRVRHILGLTPTQRNCPFWLAGVIAVVFLAGLTIPTTLGLTSRTNEQADIQEKKDQKELSKFKKTLANGVTIELVGICEYPSSDKQWWRPDGSRLDMRIITENKSGYTSDYPGYEIAFKVYGQDYNFIRGSIKGSEQGSGLNVIEPEGISAYRVHIKPGISKTKIKSGAAAGKWETVASHNGHGTTFGKVKRKKIIFSAANEFKGGLVMTISDDIDRKSATRLVAIDKNDLEHDGHIQPSLSVNEMRQQTFAFSNVLLEDIREFAFQTRSYEYVTFKNVSLKPSFKADLQVEAPLETADINDTESIDPNIKTLGEAVKKRFTTYTDEGVFTLKDGQTARMQVKENVAGIAEILITPQIVAEGTKFELEALDSKGNAAAKPISMVRIHDGDSHRTNMSVAVGGDRIFCKIQLTPERKESNSVLVEAKALFTKSPTIEELDAMLLVQGKEGKLKMHFRDIALWIMQYKQQNGYYPENLEQVNKTVPKDVYSPTGEDYQYEDNRTGFILSSCGEDGIYGNDDDEIFISYRGGARSGQRHELYPLEEVEEAEAQTETVHGERPTGNCSISGKVVSAENGEPVGHARVYLFYLGTHAPIFIDVASDGSFEFKDIPVGPYSLTIIRAPGFQNQSYDPEGRKGQWPNFTLKDGEQRSGIVFDLKRAFTISGKVFDENGQPYSTGHSKVIVWHQSTKDGGPGSIYNPNGHPSRIGSDGSYLIEALDGSPVYVMVYDYDSDKKDDYYPPCYYPGTVLRNEAKLISFDGQPNVQNMDIRLQKTGGLVLKGTVVDETGKPVPEAFVAVHHREMLFDFVTAYTNEQGNYEIQGIGGGELLAHVDAVHRGFVRTRTPIDIDTANKITRLDFTLKHGVTISGKFVDTNGNDWEIGNSFGHANIKDYPSPNSSFSLTGFRNKYRPEDIKESSGGSFLPGQGDFGSGEMIFPTKSTFIFQGMMSGKTLITFSPKKGGQIVKKILYNGQNIMESGIETKPGEEIEDVTIVVDIP